MRLILIILFLFTAACSKRPAEDLAVTDAKGALLYINWPTGCIVISTEKPESYSRTEDGKALKLVLPDKQEKISFINNRLLIVTEIQTHNVDLSEDEVDKFSYKFSRFQQKTGKTLEDFVSEYIEE